MSEQEQHHAIKLAVVGSCNIDLVIAVPHIPAPGETIMGGDLRQYMGGKGANQAVAACRLGAEVHFIGCLGDDAFGDFAMHALASEGLRLDQCQRLAGAATGVAAIAVDQQGQNSIVVASGANALLDAKQIAAATPILTSVDAVIAQLEVPLAAIRAAFAIARDASVMTVLNPAPAQPLDDALLRLVDVIICNAIEAEQLLQTRMSDAASVTAAASAFIARGARLAIITRGEQGAVLATTTGTQDIPAFTVPVRDTTAAGDAFVGAFVTQLASNATPEQAGRYATAAAALCVTRQGAQPSLPHAAEVAAFLATQG